MHIAVFADMEGSFGIWRMRQCKTGTPQWQYGRECLTADMNAVIQGAFDGGAVRVSVKDTHETGFNCILKNLDKRVTYNAGPYVRPTIFGKLPKYDLVLYVGIHAASGTKDAFFPHTHFGGFSEILLNGKQLCEMELYAGCFADFGIPMGFISGEDIAVNQALAAVPWVESVLVDKRKEAYTGGESSVQYLREGRELLREKAAAAVRNAASMKLYQYPAPLHFEARFSSEKKARRFNTWGLKQKGDTVEWVSETMTEGFDTINRLSWFPKKVYKALPLLLFLYRAVSRVKNNYFPPKPHREGTKTP
ncbi:MAG: M55 family metallopeptidase [bacterium]|nr:M55 family metallopeptidase [bacterium]